MNNIVKSIGNTVPTLLSSLNLETIGWPGVAVVGIVSLAYVANHAIDEKAKVRVEIDPEKNKYSFEVN